MGNSLYGFFIICYKSIVIKIVSINLRNSGKLLKLLLE